MNNQKIKRMRRIKIGSKEGHLILRNDMPTGEIWFVNENKFIIRKVSMDKKIGFFEYLYIYIKTVISEWLGWGKS